MTPEKRHIIINRMESSSIISWALFICCLLFLNFGDHELDLYDAILHFLTK